MNKAGQAERGKSLTMFANSKMRENCGRLIKVYREMRHASSKDHQYNCSEFILATREHPFFEVAEGQPVCSRATLNRMERGLSVRDDELYEFFIGKLGFRASEFPGVIEQAEKLGEELYSAVELYDVSKIEQLDKQIDTLFEKARNYFYYNEVYTTLKTVTDYYLNAGYPNNLTANLLLKLDFLLISKISELVFIVLFDYHFFRKCDLAKSEIVANKLKFFRSESMISSAYISFWLIYKERLLDALNCIEEAIRKFRAIDSPFHLGVLYYTKALTLHTGNKDYVKEYFDCSIKYLKKCNGVLARKKLSENYFNVGFHYYYEKNFEMAMNYYSKFLEGRPFFTMHIIYILHCTEELRTQEFDSAFREIKLNENNDNSMLGVFYKYFQMKINYYSESEIEEYIMQDIYKVMKTSFRSDNLVRYFEYELSKLVKITKRYKDLTNFSDSLRIK